MTRPLVLHLVWGPLGPLALRKFLASYHAHDAGAAHDLVVVFNGVGPQEGGAADRSSLLTELEGTEHRLVEIERPVLDLVAYAQALRLLDLRARLHPQLAQPDLRGWLAECTR